MKQESITPRLDVKAFAQSASAIAGHDLLSKYERLMQETKGLGAESVLNWSAHGEVRVDQAGAEQVWLHLTVDASLPLTCQRCLSLVDIAVAARRSFRFVDSEEAAEAQDAEAEEDVLALSLDFFNLPGLIEDEVLMALPVVPRHEECPVEVKLAAVDPGFDTALIEKRNPFAVLAKLQGCKSA
nr:YceD family protein [Rhodoferax sp.]